MVTSSETPRASAAIICMFVRWPEPTSLLPETTFTVPSALTWICPEPPNPPPWLQVWQAIPIPWKTPGRTSFAPGACHLLLQSMALAASVRVVSIPGLLKGRPLKGLPCRLKFFMRSSTGSIPSRSAKRLTVISVGVKPWGSP